MSTSTVRPSAVGTVTAFRAGDFILLPNAASGLRVITKENFNTELAALSRTTPNDGLATLNSSGKHDIAQVNYTSLDFQGTSTVAALPAPGTLTSGQFYIVTDTGTNHSKTWTQAGEMAISDGTSYYVGPVGIATVAQGGTGATTAAGARTNLDVMQTADVNDRTNARQPSNGLTFADSGYAITGTIGNGSSLNDKITVHYAVKFGGTPDANFHTIGAIGNAALGSGSASVASLWLNPDGSADANFSDGTAANTISDFIAAGDMDYSKVYIISMTADYAGTGFTVYVDGVSAGNMAIANSPAFLTAQKFQLGSSNSKGSQEVYGAWVYNRVQTAAEIAEFAAHLQTEIADQWGGAGNIYSGDSTNFASSLGNWAEAGVTAITVAQSAGTAVVTNTAATTGSRGMRNQANTFTQHKRYRLTFDCQATSGTGQKCRVRADNAGSFKELANPVNGADASGFFEFTPTGTNTTFSVELIGQHTAADAIFFDLSTNTGAGEVYAFDNVVLEPIGAVVALLPENIVASGTADDGDWVDASSNALSATGTSVTPLRVKPETSGTFTPSLYFGASLQTVSVASGTWYKDSNNPKLVFFTIRIESPSAVTDAGNVSIQGLPFNSVNSATKRFVPYVVPAGMTGLTGKIEAVISQNSDTLFLYQSNATGVANITNTSCTTSAIFTINGFYEIA